MRACACPLGRPLSQGRTRALPRWRSDSVFGAGPRQPLDRNAVARFRWLARQHRRPGGLSAGALSVAMALVGLLGADGRLDPSHAFLARLATVSEATVQRALDRLRDLGLLFWQRRLVRNRWRAEQTSNSYVLTPATAAPACDLQIARAVKLDLKKKGGIEVARAAPEVRQGAMATLAAVRIRRMRELGLG
jgi:hypothetical protein